MSIERISHNDSPARGFSLVLLAGALLVLVGWATLWLPAAHGAEVAATSPAEADAILTPAQTGVTAIASSDAPQGRPAATRAADQGPGATAQPAPAADPSAQDADQFEVLLIQALDQPTDLNVQDVPIRQAIDELAANTGIPIKLLPGVTSLLPYGSQTRLSATIQGRPLRESLTALLRPLGLQFAPARREVLIFPAPALSRIGRRATWEEMGVMEKLSSQPMTPELFGKLRFQFQDVGRDEAAAGETLARAVENIGAGSAAEVLQHACDRLGWTWHPQGEVIAILTKARQIERQLESRVTLRYVQASLPEALTDLGNRSGILVRFDPGVLSGLPPQSAERFSLSMENATVRQALEVIAGETGLTYVVEPDGIRITRKAPGMPSGAATSQAAGTISSQVEAAAQATAAALRSNSIIGQITYPLPDGSSFAFFIRESDLPPEVDAMRQAKITTSINQIRQKLHGERQQD
ncbi:MAG TPA: hypothetical protein VLM89_15550 [Phycisphaerae bacterium]|nr:hypothetical protein [Phycisphaerae bacterium]